MRNNVLNVLFFLLAAVGLYFLYDYAERNWIPKLQQKDATKESSKEVLSPEEEARIKATGDAAAQLLEKSEKARLPVAAVAGYAASIAAPTTGVKPPEPPKSEPPKVEPPKERPTLIKMGDSSFYNQVLLTTQGGGVQQIVLPKFEEADRLGREVKGTPLYLVPGVPRIRRKYLADNFPTPDLQPGKVPPGEYLAEPAYTIFHYPSPDEKYPDPKLGEMNWKIVSEEHPEGGEHKVVLEAELGEPYFFKFRKIYTLSPKNYHLGMKIEIERLPGGVKGKHPLRYQLSGPRGLPIEGEWYTSMFRVALVGWNDRKGTPRRQYETASEVATKRGGEPVPKGENTFKYMAVATQYFTSAVAIDDTEGSAKSPWAYVRATSELPFDKKVDRNTPQFEDVTVRAASEVVDLAPGEPAITHSYIIYNGPAKVKLLNLMEGDRAVDHGLVSQYLDKFGLKTVTDYQSPTWLGTFASTIYWTDLVIGVTNFMHWLLATIHSFIPSWALCIVGLTIIVRLVLLIPSKKQTKMNLKMMEVQKRLAPQLEDMKRKYGNDFNGYNHAKMKLMMANGVNPLAAMGGCLLLFAQMPIMMGLYFCLQESVFFRLDHFLWIDNLAAPDMTLWWGEHIPYLSSPDNIGGMLYLGPYLNVLPILAVVLMIGQQMAMLPPPVDEQAKQQRMTMKIMMFIMPLLFYKFAAGLALYFIIGTIWGLAERKIIKVETPPSEGGTGSPSTLPPKPGSPNGQPPEGSTPKTQGLLGRLRKAVQERMEELQRQADEQSKRQIRNDPTPGSPSSPGTPDQQPRRDDRRDKKKKRRK